MTMPRSAAGAPMDAGGDHKRTLWKTFVAFGIVGGVGTLAQYVVLIGLVRGWGVSAVVASTIGAVVGALINFFLNHRLTFRGNSSWRSSGARYVAVVAFGFVLNAVLMSVLVDRFNTQYVVAQVISTAVCFIVNFMMSNYWAFRKR